MVVINLDFGFDHILKVIFIGEEDALFDPIHISLLGFVGTIFQANLFSDSSEQFLRLLTHIIVIIYYPEVLVDMLL